MRYLRPAELDDLLTVTAAVEHLGRAQFTLEQRVLRGAELLVQGVGQSGLRHRAMGSSRCACPRMCAPRWSERGPAQSHNEEEA